MSYYDINAQIRELRDQKFTWGDIAQQLNVTGYRNINGDPFTPHSVRWRYIYQIREHEEHLEFALTQIRFQIRTIDEILRDKEAPPYIHLLSKNDRELLREVRVLFEMCNRHNENIQDIRINQSTGLHSEISGEIS